jgi:hypothetical protein
MLDLREKFRGLEAFVRKYRTLSRGVYAKGKRREV